MSNNSNSKKKVVVIGAGFAGLSSACYLAKAGFEVTVLEKNAELGGRARVWEKETDFGNFKFDMGPSWYWMPRVFEDFFGDFGRKTSDFYNLQKLETQYRMFVKPELNADFGEKSKTSNLEKAENENYKTETDKTGKIGNLQNSETEINSEITEKSGEQFDEKENNNKQNLGENNLEISKNLDKMQTQINSQKIEIERQGEAESEAKIELEEKIKNSENGSKLQNLFGQNWVDLPSNYDKIKEMFELIEPKSGQKLDEFVRHGEYTYDKGVREYMQKPSLSVLEFANFDFLSGVVKAGILESFGKFVRENFNSPIIRQMLEFPVLFLGATPKDTPKIYTLMAYTCLKEGTFYPDGGFGKVSEALVNLAQSLGVKFETGKTVTKISDKNGKVSGVWVKNTINNL